MRLGLFGSAYRSTLAALVAGGLLFADVEGAEASRQSAPYAPPYAAMVVDAKTGRILHAENPDTLRRPASITKVMTLYLLFEQMERGRMTLDTELKVSAFAAHQAPSKLALSPGDTIRVEDAIKALVTKSANDVAVVVAENIAGSEPAFAEMMTRKARALGMSRTVFRNASGLPDPHQVTTARDLVTLGRAIQDRFPRQYAFFSTRVFNFDGDAYANHNKLLGRVEGVDGIKTGFTRLSGFNLLTSAKHDGRQVVAVVLGGRSGPSRDRIMEDLIETHLPRAQAGPRTAPAVAERDAEAPATTAAVPSRAARPVPAQPVQAAPSATVEQGDSSSSARTASVRAAPAPQASAPAPSRPSQADPEMKWSRGAEPTQASTRVASAAPAASAASTPAKASGWYVQVGVADTRAKADGLVAEARAKSKGKLSKARPVTERITLRNSPAWRVRFTGLDADDAAAACRILDKADVDCFAARS